MKKLYKEDIIDLLYGCAVLGTGGGGSLTEGLAMMKEDFEQGRSLQLVSLDEIPDDAIVASPYGCGAPSASSNPEDRFQGLPRVKGSPAVLAFQSLEEFLGGKNLCCIIYGTRRHEYGRGITCCLPSASSLSRWRSGRPVCAGTDSLHFLFKRSTYHPFGGGDKLWRHYHIKGRRR